MRRLQGRASELVLKGQIQESRQAFEEGLKGICCGGITREPPVGAFRLTRPALFLRME